MHKLFNANKAKLGHRLNLDSPNSDLGRGITLFYVGQFVIGGRVYIKIVNFWGVPKWIPKIGTLQTFGTPKLLQNIFVLKMRS
jgi:hypothetical protein